MLPDLREVLQRQLADWRAGWSVGSFGAIAEFHQDPDEALEVDDPDALTRATARGAIRIGRLDGVTPVAYETLSPRPHRWSQGVALCLPAARAQRSRRTVLTELDPDQEAIRPADRSAILFDMGLGLAQIDFCVRSADPELIALLRGVCGRPLAEPGNPAMGAILAAHPHRVALSNIGRAEVYQKIGGPETGGASPAGPHTHVLAKLLATGRTHSANTPIPEGLIPCASLHPGSPVMGPLGEDRPFDPALFDAFQNLLAAWGSGDYLAVKRAVWSALDAGRGSDDADAPTTRLGRAALRNALRQRARAAGETPLIAAWRDRFDRVAADDTDNDAPGH